MAKIVIAGHADCPYYAKTELLADSLVKNLPNFELHKIVVKPNEWATWLQDTCQKQKWSHNRSPMVWRELVDRGGKGMLIGGPNEFQEYAMGYYGTKSDFISDDMTKIGDENAQTKVEVDTEVLSAWQESQPVHVCITHASCPAAYAMVTPVAKGVVLGADTEVTLKLYETEDKVEGVPGIEMEAFDLACHLLRDSQTTSDIEQAFADCSAIVLLDEILQNEGETKDAWLKRNHELFSKYGETINKVAKKDVKVLVAGKGPVNFNAHTILQSAPDIPRENVMGCCRLVENRAKALLADRLKVNSAGLADVTVWGSVTGSSHVELSHARVRGYEGAIWGPASFTLPAVEMVHDNKWLSTEFPTLVSGRGGEVESAMTHRAAMSEADAAMTLLRDWCNGSANGEIYSAAVCSKGWYDVPEGLVFSFPVTFDTRGQWKVVEGIELLDEVKQKVKDIAQELKAETEFGTAVEEPSEATEGATSPPVTENTQEQDGSKPGTPGDTTQQQDTTDQPADTTDAEGTTTDGPETETENEQKEGEDTSD